MRTLVPDSCLSSSAAPGAAMTTSVEPNSNRPHSSPFVRRGASSPLGEALTASFFLDLYHAEFVDLSLVS